MIGTARKVRGLPALLACLSACGSSSDQELSFVDGASTLHIPIRSAYAEAIELPGLRHELRLTFTDYAAACERWIPPKDDGHAVTVVVATPPRQPPKAGTYAWTGILPDGSSVKEAYALPKVLLPGKYQLLEPGGVLRLTRVELRPHGSVSGALAFEFPGSAERPPTRLSGTFEAKICRSSEPSR